MTTSINRRRFTQSMALAGISSLGATALLGCEKKTAAPQAAQPSNAATPAVGELVAGIDYKVLPNPVPTTNPEGTVSMLEFFGYWCPHCSNLAPEIEAWHKQAPKNIAFEMVPVNFGAPQHDALQRLFYALRDIKKLDAMHLKVFDAVHKQKAPMGTREAIFAWAKEQPELKDSGFEQAYDSFSVEQSVNRAQQLINAYQLDGVPSFGVDGKYYVDGTLAKSLTRAIYIAEKLAVEAAQKPA